MATGIIAEFNPLHKGHEYLIKNAKEQGTVVCVLSGNFVQRGETAIAEKRLRTLAALRCGADLVLELPVLWSMSTAQNFALGAVSILKNAQCENLMFGSECGNADELVKTADILCESQFSEKLSAELAEGVTFAKARQRAALNCGASEDILAGANNNLAIEYIIAAKKIGYIPKLLTVKRIGAAHDSFEESQFVSASLLRKKLRTGEFDFCKRYMSNKVTELLIPENISDMKNIERAVLAVLRTKSIQDFKKLPDISEGVENKLFSAIRLATSLEDLYNEIKVKRYTHARIRRLVLSAFLGADASFFMKSPPYIRVLGFNKKGEKHLRKLKSDVPIVVRAADIKGLSAEAQKVFEIECRATDLFGLSLPQVLECGLEYTSRIIKTE